MNVNETLQTTTMKFGQWDVQYAKFFTFPITSPTYVSSSSSSLLRPLASRQKRRLKGTWVPCTSTHVALHVLINHNSFSESTLLVSLNGIIYGLCFLRASADVHKNHLPDKQEEHYISKLNFLWPQGNCLDESSIRKIRVIFACYRDRMDQIQKFAMPFSSSQECQKFMEVLKCLKDGSEVNFSSVMLSNVFSEGIERENIHTMQSINREHALGAYSESQQEAFGHAPESTDMALPESFTALLANCFAAADPGAFQASTEIDLNIFLGAGSKADKPFIDLLEKMDNIIVGLGGDLKL